MMTMLSIRDWNVFFETPAGPLHALKNINLTLERGRVLGLAGGSGSGKSQLFLSLFGLLARNGRALGTALFDGVAIDDPHALLGRRVGFIFQNPLTALTPHLTIGAQMAESLVYHSGLSQQDAHTRCRTLLDQCRIPESARRLKQYPHELSGGMRQRVMIAQALTLKPDLIIADEPTTALDVTVQAQIMTLLRELQKEYGLTMAFISHDMGVMAGIADDIAIMHEGCIVEHGTVEAVFAAPQTDLARDLIAARTATKPDDLVRPQPKETVLVAHNIAVHFPVRQGWAKPRILRAVDGVSFDLAAGETLVVLGESGCGKSTLGRACLGLIPSTHGHIELCGIAIGAQKQQDVRRTAQIVFQDPLAALDPRMTVGQSVIEPLETLRPDMPKAEHRARAANLFAEVGLHPTWLDRYPHELSGGQNQRVGIARALIVEPRLIVCDESISALDTATARNVMALLRRQQEKYNLALLFITHDLIAAAEIGTRILTLYLGRCVEMGPVDRVLKNPQHPYTKALIASAPVADVAAMRARPPVNLTGDPPSPFDPAAALRFLPSRSGDISYRPRLMPITPTHWVEEHD